MLEAHPLLIYSEHIPDWLAIAQFAFWAGLPALARWVLNLEEPEGANPW